MQRLFLIFVGFISAFDSILCINVKIAAILPEDDRRMFSSKRVAPAIEYAVEYLHNNTEYLRGHNFSVSYGDSKCSAANGMNEAIKFYIRGHADLFLGPVCDYSLAPVARQAMIWNTPIISVGALARDFTEYRSQEYALLSRFGPVTVDALSRAYLNMIKHYHWSNFKIIYDKDGQTENIEAFCFLMASALHYEAKATEPNITQDYFKMTGEFGDILKSEVGLSYSGSALIYYIKELKADDALEHDFMLYTDTTDTERMLKDKVGVDYSVVVLCASADSVREIMIKAHELNFDNGEYVFFNIDLFSSKNESKKPWYREDDTKERNDKARKAYEALMTVTLRKPTSPEYKNFSREVKRRAKLRYENFTYGEEEVNSFVGAFHDAVILYALALNETLEANRSITNGTEITRRMWNRTFSGITGNVSIDDNGDRNADYSLLDMNPDTGEFEVVANYFGNTKRYEPVPGRHIRWAGDYDHAPPDTPKCGFDNSKCPPEEPFPEYGIVIIVLGSLLLLVVVAAFFIYRHIKLEAELAEMNWRVKWEDIMLGTIEGERKMKKQTASNLSLARTEDSSYEGNLLIERTRPSVNNTCCTWCKCGQCDVTERNRRVCCRHIEKLEERLEDRLQAERCITSTKDFQDVVLNPQVLLTVYIHVMLARKQRGSAPYQLTPYKCRLMATRQFLCWLHSGEVLERQTKWAIPACVVRAIKLMFPEVGAEMTSGDDACSLTLEDILPLENHSSV